MPITTILKKPDNFPIQAYQRPSDPKRLRETHVSFDGSPHKHPHDLEKVVLVADPFSTNTFYYEFLKSDISFAEELPSLISPDQAAATMVRIWVKKGSIGIRCTPFMVADLRRR
ncbi:MAG: inorganic pyrophosphatase Ppa [Desulfobacterales bacterium]